MIAADVVATVHKPHMIGHACLVALPTTSSSQKEMLRKEHRNWLSSQGPVDVVIDVSVVFDVVIDNEDDEDEEVVEEV